MNEKFFDLKKEKQDRMLNAAFKVFAENGFRRASTDEMVREAGVSKGLLFHYFTSKTGLYEFLYDYSVKYLVMELSPLTTGARIAYFPLRRQVEKAKCEAMKNFPYIQLFLRRAEREDAPETLEVMREPAEALLAAYDAIYDRVVFDDLTAMSSERLARIVEYTLNGLLEEMLAEPRFAPERYYEEACRYLQALENACVGTASESPI